LGTGRQTANSKQVAAGSRQKEIRVQMRDYIEQKGRKAENNQPQTSADGPFINHEEHEEKIGSLR